MIRTKRTLALITSLVPVSVALSENRNLTGWDELKARLGSAMPTGAGIRVQQIEAAAPSGGYLPFKNMGTGEFLGKTNIDLTGNQVISSHAGTVGKNFYGNTLGYAPGITIIESYSATNWLSQVLDWDAAQTDHAGFIASLDPGDVQIINNSWISTETNTFALRALRRADFQAEYYDVIYVNGVNNGAGSSMPPLMCSMYNGIAVGREDGNSSSGPTTFEGSLSKPDIVTPDTATSWSTGQVSGAVALLLEQGVTMGVAESAKPQVIKAILHAGAEKPVDWEKGNSTPDDDVVRPLDRTYGAGKLRVDRNYDILAGGPVLGGASLLPRRSWAYDLIGHDDTHEYLVHIATGDTTLTVGLAWLRHHTGLFFIDGVFALNNIALEVWATDANLAATQLLQESRSLTDNAQHVHLTGLARGAYLVRLTGLTNNPPGPEAYGLAWWSDGTILKGDMNGDGDVDAFDIGPFVLSLTDPEAFASAHPGVEALAWGDMNNDGTLDAFDIADFVAAVVAP